MELTGKCKVDFEKWLVEFDWELKSSFYTIKILLEDIDIFNQLPESMQFGVMVDFFDSVGIDIEVSSYIEWDDDWITASANGFKFYVGGFKNQENAEFTQVKTRQEARTKAIEKANEIYNAQGR